MGDVSRSEVRSIVRHATDELAARIDALEKRIAALEGSGGSEPVNPPPMTTTTPAPAPNPGV